MITRSEYKCRVDEILRYFDDLRRSVNFLTIFTPELSCTSIVRQCTRLEESAEQLTALSKQLRAVMNQKG